MSEQINEQELNAMENDAIDKMSHGLKEIWKIIIFCCIGWLMVCIGTKTNYFCTIGHLCASLRNKKYF